MTIENTIPVVLLIVVFCCVASTASRVALEWKKYFDERIQDLFDSLVLLNKTIDKSVMQILNEYKSKDTKPGVSETKPCKQPSSFESLFPVLPCPPGLRPGIYSEKDFVLGRRLTQPLSKAGEDILAGCKPLQPGRIDDLIDDLKARYAFPQAVPLAGKACEGMKAMKDPFSLERCIHEKGHTFESFASSLEQPGSVVTKETIQSDTRIDKLDKIEPNEVPGYSGSLA